MIAREIVQTRLQLTVNRKLPALIFNQGIISMDKEARQPMTTKW